MISCSLMPGGGEESSSPSPRCAAAEAIRKKEKTASQKRQAEIRGTLIEVPVFIVFDRNPLKWECCGEKKAKENDRAGLESILLSCLAPATKWGNRSPPADETHALQQIPPSHDHGKIRRQFFSHARS